MEEYLEQFKNKKKIVKHTSKKKYKNIITKFLLAIIFFLASLIFTNFSDKNLLLYKEYVLTESIPFTKIKGVYENIFGNILPKDTVTTEVFNGKLIYKSINDYLEGEELFLNNSEAISLISSGVVVYSGEKEGYGNTIIIQGIDGVDIWYGNLTNVSVNLYDYLEKDTIIGETVDNKLYLVIKKNNEYIKYEDYKDE